MKIYNLKLDTAQRALKAAYESDQNPDLHYRPFVDLSFGFWPFPKMFVAFPIALVIPPEVVDSWGKPEYTVSSQYSVDRFNPNKFFCFGVVFGLEVGDPNAIYLLCGAVNMTAHESVVYKVPVLLYGNIAPQGQVMGFYMLLIGELLSEIKHGNPLNLEVLGGRAHTPTPTSEPKPLPEPYYPVQSGPSYTSSQTPETSGGPTKPLRFQHDRRGNEAVRVMRGKLPLGDKRRRHLGALEYRIYDDKNKKMSADDDKRLKRRGKRGRRPDEWLAIKSWWRRDTVVGDPELPYIPGTRGN